MLQTLAFLFLWLCIIHGRFCPLWFLFLAITSALLRRRMQIVFTEDSQVLGKQ